LKASEQDVGQELGHKPQHDAMVLLPLEVMAKPLEMRFRYHFDSDRPTNRPDKVITYSSSRGYTLTRLARILSFSRPWSTEYL
jgi:hypothetical protein